MPLLISRTYSEITPESSEQGDFSEQGFVHEKEPFSFRELVSALREGGFDSSSCYPPRGGAFEWAQTPFEITDYRTGTERQECLHFSRSNPPQKLKYWRKAFKAAGIIK